MAGVTYSRGVVRATLLAGPLFLVVMSAADLIGPTSTSVRWPEAWAVPFLILATSIIGATLAVLPSMVGAAALGALGRGNIGLRLPASWALVGAGAGALLGALAGPGVVPVMAAVGAGCALVCRSGTSWDD